MSAQRSAAAASAELPAALLPWRAWLIWLAPDQIAAMGEMLPRLEAVTGRPQGARLSHGLELDGVDDLRQRGPYHRLLLSEWAVADIAPDEFLRRASSGEHLFLSTRPVTRKSDAELIALFDAGPSQLGAPRLVHIALWILLARRAEVSGMRFRWGTLAAAPQLFDANDAERLKDFLSQRTLHCADQGAIASWRQALIPTQKIGGERWWIGASMDDLTGIPVSHRVAVQREWLEALQVDIAGSTGRRSVALPLPASAAASRLLLGQFSFEVTTRAAPESVEGYFSLRQPPLIGSEGTRIAVPLLGKNAAMIYTRPNRSGKPGTATRSAEWSTGHELLCATLGHKQLAGIIVDQSHLYFWNFSGFRPRPRPEPQDFQTPPGQAHWRPCVWLTGTRKPHDIFVLDSRGNLLRWRSDSAKGGSPPQHDRLAQDVLAIARIDGETLGYLQFRQQRIELILHSRLSGVEATMAQGAAPRKPARAFLHTRGRLRSKREKWTGAWCMAEAGDSRIWSIYAQRADGGRWEHVQIRIGEHWRGYGLVQRPGADDFGLVARSPDRRQLVLIDAHGQTDLYHSDSPIAGLSVACDCDLIACLTEDHRLVSITPGGEDPVIWHSHGDHR
jgi:hypothetical protein